MPNIKKTPRKQKTESPMKHIRSVRIPCILCGKSYANIRNLRRHVNNTHAAIKTWYRCKMCKRTIGRKSDYDRHMNSLHPGYHVEPEVFEDHTREEAKKPENKRPFEALTKKQLQWVKFKTRPASNIIPGGPPTRPIIEEAMDRLREDLALSDSNSTTSSTNSSVNEEQVDYRKLKYQSESASTICLDEH